jgi:MFS family permease
MDQGLPVKAPRSLLGTPQFAALVITAFVSNTGSWMQSFSEQWVVVGLAGAEAARWSGRLSFALGLAVLVLTPFGGALVDRFDRRRLLAASQIWLAVSAALLGLLALLPGGLTLPRLLAFALATGVGVALAVPALHSLFPDLLPREKLAAASGLMSAQFNLSRMIGPVLAALAIPLVGVAGTFLHNALS